LSVIASDGGLSKRMGRGLEGANVQFCRHRLGATHHQLALVDNDVGEVFYGRFDHDRYGLGELIELLSSYED
jgi:hypothetical protein